MLTLLTLFACASIKPNLVTTNIPDDTPTSKVECDPDGECTERIDEQLSFRLSNQRWARLRAGDPVDVGALMAPWDETTSGWDPKGPRNCTAKERNLYAAGCPLSRGNYSAKECKIFLDWTCHDRK